MPNKGNPKSSKVIIPALQSSGATPITNETISVAAGAAGTVKNFYIAQRPILDSNGAYIGGKGDTSISIISGTVFTTEVVYGTEDADLANGEYWIDYLTGHGRGKKADTTTSMIISYQISVEKPNPSSIISYSKTIIAAGTPTRVIPYVQAATLAFVDGGGGSDTITDSGNNFIKNGFALGQTVTISGAAQSGNNKIVTLTNVAAGTLTLPTGSLTTELAGATVTIQTTGGIPIPPGMKAVIKAKYLNTANKLIFPGNSSAHAAWCAANGAFSLRNNERIEYFDRNLNGIWMDTDNSGEGFEVTAESNQS